MDRQLKPEGLFGALKDLLAWLDSSSLRWIVIGGIAVSLLSRPRNTQDIDVMVFLEPERWETFFVSGAAFGFQPRIGNAIQFAMENRVLLLKHEPTLTDVDISFGALPFERESIERSQTVQIQNLSVPVPSVEDLIIMKAVARRPIDMEDIRNILKLNRDIDCSRIKYWVKEFAGILEMPEMLSELEAILRENG